MDIPRLTFRDAYLVGDPAGGYAGVVCRERGTWRALRLDGGSPDIPPTSVVRSREDAGRHLLEPVVRGRCGLLDALRHR